MRMSIGYGPWLGAEAASVSDTVTVAMASSLHPSPWCLPHCRHAGTNLNSESRAHPAWLQVQLGKFQVASEDTVCPPPARLIMIQVLRDSASLR